MTWHHTPDGSHALYGKRHEQSTPSLIACVCKRVAPSGAWYVVSMWNGPLWQAVAKARTLKAAKRWAEARV